MKTLPLVITAHGKWILAGEHAVLRGHGALVFPVKEKKLTLTYHATQTPLSISASGLSSTIMQKLFARVLHAGCMRLSEQIITTGHFHIENTIPLGMGMGASAALCVTVSRWFAQYVKNFTQDIIEFAKELEHLFHGQSSGLDVTGVSMPTGGYFKQGMFTPIQQTWEPIFCLSHCGVVGLTADCVRDVNALWQRSPIRAAEIDKTMDQCVDKAREALMAQQKDAAQSQLIHAMEVASTCFKDWGIVNDALAAHMHDVRAHGALAVKPTGAGGGGFVVSLWNSKQLIPQIDNMFLLL